VIDDQCPTGGKQFPELGKKFQKLSRIFYYLNTVSRSAIPTGENYYQVFTVDFGHFSPCILHLQVENLKPIYRLLQIFIEGTHIFCNLKTF